MLSDIVIIIIGIYIVLKGADLLTEGAVSLAQRMDMPKMLIGLTVVAVGTSMPEFFVSVTSALQGTTDLAVANVVGSNILNILIILGITSAIVSVAVAKSTIRYEIPYMMLITLLFLWMGYTGHEISFVEGIGLWAAFIFYLGYLFIMAKKHPENNEDDGNALEHMPVWKMLIAVVVGLGLIIWGSDIAVDAATDIAKFIGLSDRFIGLTIVALGTSLPELFTSVSAAIKGKADIAIGNIVGSNIFNILFVVGTTALITPVVFETNFLIDTLIAFGAGLLLLLCVMRRKKLVRWHGIVMLAAYGIYFAYLLMV